MSGPLSHAALIRQWLAANPGTEQEARAHLKAHNWDLAAALNSTDKQPPGSEANVVSELDSRQIAAEPVLHKSPATAPAAKPSTGGGASASSAAGSSGRQAQMVFTVGTFDEDDDEDDDEDESESDNLQSQLARSRGGGRQASENSNSNSDGTISSGAVGEEPRPHASSWEDDSSNINKAQPQSNNRRLLEPRRNLVTSKRQPLFTMGSHSEFSDIEGTDSPGEASEHSLHTSRRPQTAEGSRLAHASDSKKGKGRSPQDDTASNDADPTKNTGAAEDSISTSASGSGGKSRAGGGSGAPNAHANAIGVNDQSSETPDYASRGSAKSVASGSELAWKSKGLHACKATTSLSQLYNLADSNSGFEESADSDAAAAADGPEDTTPPPALVLHARVTGVPATNATAPSNEGAPAADEGARQPNVAAVAENKQPQQQQQQPQQPPPSEHGAQHKGKSRAPLASKDSHVKLRKKVASKKTHVKKATSTAALRSRQRHAAGYRRDASGARALGYSKAVLDYGHADSSYVDYSGSSSGEDGSDEDAGAGQPGHGDRAQKPGSPAAPAQAAAPQANLGGLEQSQASLHSSTATLGGACQDLDDTATTASTGCSPRAEQQAAGASSQQRAAAASEAAAQHRQSADVAQQADQSGGQTRSLNRGDAANLTGGASKPTPSHAAVRAEEHQYADSKGPGASPPPTPPHVRGPETPYSQQQQQDPEPGRHQAEYTDDGDAGSRSKDSSSAYASHDTNDAHRMSGGVGPNGTHSNSSRNRDDAYLSMSTKRNMESQRQQSIVEKEEEDLEITTSILTGVRRSCNRPSSMVPHVFLNPNTAAYGQQIRKTERSYAYARSTTHPLLESISRCVALREQRAALDTSRGQARTWVSRRSLTEPPSDVGVSSSSQADWWDSLLPPPPSSSLSRDQRSGSAGHSSRVPAMDLPRWVLKPDDARCAVYGPEMFPVPSSVAMHEQTDPTCPHVRELRAKAKELKFARQQALAAARRHTVPPPRLVTTSTAALETWRGRRVPGLLSVEMYAGSTVPVDGGGRHGQRSGTDTIASSPDSAPALRGNQLAPPYRRYGTVYGYTAGNVANARNSSGLRVTTPTAGGFGGGGGMGDGGQGSAGLTMRRQHGAGGNRPSTAGIWENDPRRSSYFDRLSVDETRPQLSASAAQASPAGLLRRVISGLTGGASSYGAS